ncbi:type I restriction-modification system subunit M [Streptomyces sp. NBRC 110028]|uniref:type I restriction-modification system subunit M n=1 Tax=Streptomyces sp. NBRC 110028 TaxID=1621260 RepID=UPI0006E45815|nr:type I restriction-modification system subunit M [Streptomyces sp. NBRC 110028]
MPPSKRKPTDTAALLWKATATLRGSTDASQHKTVVLTLLYLRFLSLEFERSRRELGDTDDTNAPAYAPEGMRWIPPLARWDTLTRRIQDPDCDPVAVLDEAIMAVMQSNNDLTGVLPGAPALIGNVERRRITELFALFGDALVTADGRRPARDTMGELYQYLSMMYADLLAESARAEGKKGGEFHTPSSVATLLVETLRPRQGRVYDPCCGTGGLLVQAAKFAEVHGACPSVDLEYYGQEVNERTWQLARMNLDIHGLLPASLGCADTLAMDLLPNLKADTVLANPPFNTSDWARREADPRWQYGTPPRRNANYAWLQHIVGKLSDRGSAGVVLANGALSSKWMGEDEIREAMAEDDLLACVVALPSQLFTSTQIPACVWFLTKDKSSQANRGLTDRRGQTLFIDARAMGEMVSRAHRVLTSDELDEIVGTYHAWRGTDSWSAEYRDVPGFCCSAGIDEIREHQHILTPGRYVGVEEADQERGGGRSHELIDVLTRELLQLLDRADQLEEEMRRHLDA